MERVWQREVLDGRVDRGRQCHEGGQQRAEQAQAGVGAQHAGDRRDLSATWTAATRRCSAARPADHADRGRELPGQHAVGRVEREQGSSVVARQHAQLVIADLDALGVAVVQRGLDERGRGQLRGRERAAAEQSLGLRTELEVEEAHDEAQLGLELARRQREVEVDDVSLVAEHERLRIDLRERLLELRHVQVAELQDVHLEQA